MKTMSRAQAAELGRMLVENATSDRGRVAAQALAEEETILAHGGVRAALVVKQDGRMRADWDRLMGRVYTLSFDDEQRAFVGLVLSMLGIGSVPLSAVENLDERRLLIMQRAIVRLAGNDRIAVGTRM
ncbi:hypothetical protein [Streptomyces sp. NPDC057403]|uniref:hypothetical protein n=1 Tax=Streptomyces sp. NPDC057403 TaxID=3346119 RepID=UPI0036AFFD54